MIRFAPLVCLLAACSLRSEPVAADPVCGNALIEAQEACDDGNTSDEDGCSSLCRLTFCGDGLVQPWEA